MTTNQKVSGSTPDGCTIRAKALKLEPQPLNRLTQSRFLWVALGTGILLAVFLISILTAQRDNPSSQSSATPAGSVAAAHQLSPIDAVRLAEIARLGPTRTRVDTNAAVLYHEANELYKKLSADDRKALRDLNKDLDPNRVADLRAKIQPIMQLLRNARDSNLIDWGPHGFSAAEGQKQAEANGTVLALGRVAAWDATYQFDTNPALALSDLLAAGAMASSHALDPTGYTISCSVHEDDLAVLEQNTNALASLSPQDDALISDSTWIAQDFKMMAAAGASDFQGLLNQYLSPETHDQATKTTSETFLSGPVAGATVDAQGLVAELQWTVQALQQYGNSIQDSYAQYQQWSTQMEAESASMPIGDLFYGAHGYFQMNRTYAESATVQYAMLSAGIALLQGNETKFQSIADPATGQPFTVLQTTGGFQLSSPYKNYAGQQLIIPFGTPPAK